MAAVSVVSGHLVSAVFTSEVCSRPSFILNRRACFDLVHRFQVRSSRQSTKKTLCLAHADDYKSGDQKACDNIRSSPQSEDLPATKREFLVHSAAAAAAVAFPLPESALAEGANFAVDEVTGKPIAVSELLQKAASVDRILVRGLDNNPTYLLVDNGKVAEYALRAVCTHMGCTPDWVGADGKFECPCHGSQYNARGEVVEGPAPENLALVHVNVEDGKVRLDDWNEADFRNGETDPWWI